VGYEGAARSWSAAGLGVGIRVVIREEINELIRFLHVANVLTIDSIPSGWRLVHRIEPKIMELLFLYYCTYLVRSTPFLKLQED
jgi:hypothetical protein